MADIFAKPLAAKHFFRFRNQIMNVDEGMVASAPPAPTRPWTRLPTYRASQPAADPDMQKAL